MKVVGILFFLLGLYGVFSTYRVLRYKELYWYYPLLRYRKEGGYSKIICNLVGIFSIPVILLFFYIAFICLFPNNKV